ncbi:Protein farnesyltransferase/geranylgeranyltransferase type-1 subunit alpha [Colletotrichum sp. SAR11_240]|nr:Protein farnesyltransferase/geranylgeranyltransferase type-1 subunit alpha [Colletotrichum sp. SAR11_240]
MLGPVRAPHGPQTWLLRSETEFLTRMLEEDTKNYHVWSYRQYMVRKLGLWNLQELLSTQNWIEEDVGDEGSGPDIQFRKSNFEADASDAYSALSVRQRVLNNDCS